MIKPCFVLKTKKKGTTDINRTKIKNEYLAKVQKNEKPFKYSSTNNPVCAIVHVNQK